MTPDLPTIEVLEANHEFPCRYTFKAIGPVDDHFVGRVLTVVKRELHESAEPSFSTRESKGGRHVSVTIEPDVQDAEHVLAIYRQILTVDGLLLLF